MKPYGLKPRGNEILDSGKRPVAVPVVNKKIARRAARNDIVTAMSDPVCRTCKDTHQMVLHGHDDTQERMVPCTFCPTPCRTCQYGAYCRATPCDCPCHRARLEGVVPQQRPSLADVLLCKDCFAYGYMDKMLEAAKTVMYPYFEWGARIYSAETREFTGWIYDKETGEVELYQPRLHEERR